MDWQSEKDIIKKEVKNGNGDKAIQKLQALFCGTSHETAIDLIISNFKEKENDFFKNSITKEQLDIARSQRNEFILKQIPSMTKDTALKAKSTIRIAKEKYFELKKDHDWGASAYITPFQQLDKYRESFFMDSEALEILGYLYRKGIGTEISLDRAFVLFTRSAEMGNKWGQAKLGDAYRLGEGTEADYEKSFNWFLKAANQGHVIAQIRIGDFYKDGYLDGQPNYLKALEYYVRAAASEHHAAYRNIGELYEEGMGVEQDVITAKIYYELAKSKGNTHAQNYLEVNKL